MLVRLTAPHRLGVDRSPAMLDAARRRLRAAGQEATLAQADLRAWDPPPFDLALAACNTLNLLDDDERRALFVRLRRAALPGARLAFDLYVWTEALSRLAPTEPPRPPSAAPRRAVTRHALVETLHLDHARRRALLGATLLPGGARQELVQHLPEAKTLLRDLRDAGWQIEHVGPTPDTQTGCDTAPRLWVLVRAA